LEKRYPGPRGAQQAPAVRDLDLDIDDGELLVLVGPSGCGKSTALRLVAGLEQPDRGRIELDGRDLGPLAPQDRDIAMVFQGYALYPHLRAREIIEFPLKMRSVPKRQRDRKVEETAALLGLERLLDRRPAELSGGEQQRVAMARAIVRAPKAFLFDEPLSNLDAKLRAELRVELARLVRRLGVTSIYVTHDQAEAMTMGDRVAVLRAGELQQVAPPREIYQRPANTFVAGFLGTPAMNLIELSVAEGRGRAPGIDLPLPAGLPAGEDLTVGVRPEHVDLAPVDGGEDGRARLQATVLSVEPLGAETYLHLDADGTPLRGRIAGFDAPRPGDEITVQLAPEDLLWFDSSTGERLSPRSESDG
jgi:multiple sugar transport system ATP-binding protein